MTSTSWASCFAQDDRAIVLGTGVSVLRGLPSGAVHEGKRFKVLAVVVLHLVALTTVPVADAPTGAAGPALLVQ
jgi:hypothetical protein